ncbi:MAG TPA: hypothetical protein PLV20_00940 [Anaerolineaceae bacterium]|jgi:hypothetical protein|nr:hypothetical protein [Anaerolineales bacterium]HQK42138.1 hypothetical protein [Anaerolineaceae bacterium]
MLIRVGLEYGIGGRTLAWGLDFPGCFAFGEEDAELMLRFAKALLTFEEWVRLHTDEPWFQLLNPDFRIVEAYHNKQNSAGGEDEESRAAFEDDLRPLEREEITNALQVFRWQREELLAGLEFLPARLFEQTIPGQGWKIMDVVKQIARTECLYLKNLDLPVPDIADGTPPLNALQLCRQQVEKLLPGLEGSRVAVEQNGELWTGRKLVRRLLWQQRVRIDEIKSLACAADD